MGAYRPIFSIEVEHTYFSQSWQVGLDFVPTPTSLMLIEKYRLLMRYTSNGVRVFFDPDNSDVVLPDTADPDEPPALTFKAFTRDKFFRTYTDLNMPEEDAILYFDNERGKIDKTDRFRLHDAGYVSAKDFEKCSSPRITNILSQKDRLLKPELIISIRFGKKEIQALEAASKTSYSKYYIKFQARQTFWKYYLLGSVIERKSYIADQDNEMEFEDTGRDLLPDNREALTFRSKKRIPLRERSEYRFQLKEIGPNGGKVIIRRLPVASAGQYIKEIVDGKEAIVSEIFINC